MATAPVMRAICAGCGLDVQLPVEDFTAIDAGQRIQLVWRCEGCGFGELTSESVDIRALILASGCAVLHVEHDGPGVLRYLVDGPAYPRRRRGSPLTRLARLVCRCTKPTEKEDGSTNG